MSRLNLFLTNVFDIPITETLKSQFISSNNLDLKKLIQHPLLFTNMIYFHIWKYCYDTFPTKKDFSMFVKANNIDLYVDNISFPKITELIVNSFFPLKVGHLKNINPQQLLTYIETNIGSRKNDINFREEFLIKKWNYRFGDKSYSRIANSENIMTSFMNIQQLYEPFIVTSTFDEHINIFTKNYNENIEFNAEWDNVYLTDFEKIQYILYSDTNLFSRCADNAIIILDDPTIPQHILANILNVYEKQFSKLSILVDLGLRNNIHDSYFTVRPIPGCLYMLPKLFKACLCISNKAYPSIKSFSKNIKTSIFYSSSLSSLEENKNDPSITQTYNRILVANDSLMSLHQNAFMIPYFYDYNSNNLITPHNIIYIEQGLYNQYKDKLDKFGSSKGIQILVISDNGPKENADFVINFLPNINIKEYVVRGIIPILKTKQEAISNLVNGFYAKDIDDAIDQMSKLYESETILLHFKKNCELLKYVYNKEYITSIWKDHLQLECPFSCKESTNALNNILVLHNFVFKYFDANIEKIANIRMNPSAEYKVVLIDNRETPLSIISTIFTLCNLQKDYWSCTIYTSSKSSSYYKTYLNMFADIQIQEEFDKVNTHFHIDIYNQILKTPTFWEPMVKNKVDKCLIIQNDGFILQEGVEKFLQYDYVGAPWADVSGNEYLKNKVNTDMVGNGGLSLRNVSKMLHISKTFEQEKKYLFFHAINVMPEDVYFCKCLKKLENTSMPDASTAGLFSSEEVYNPKSIGVHRLWSYHSTDILCSYFKSILT